MENTVSAMSILFILVALVLGIPQTVHFAWLAQNSISGGLFPGNARLWKLDKLA